MAITKQYVELMGGAITFQSKKNCGSSFTVEIPMELADEKEIPEQKTVQNISLNGVKVLLVEDNDLNAELAVTLLEDAGMCVTRAVDGEDAVKLFASNPDGYHDAKNERISGNEGNPNNERGTSGCSNHSYHSPVR